MQSTNLINASKASVFSPDGANLKPLVREAQLFNIMEIEINSKVYGRHKVVIDDNDYEKIKDGTITLTRGKNKNYYASIRINGYEYLLHRYILNLPEYMIDHIDRNGLNCQKNNLRPASLAENARNKDKNKNNKCGYKCVWYCRKTNRYRVQVMANRIKYDGGSSLKTLRDAVIKANELMKKHHGEFAFQNQIPI